MIICDPTDWNLSIFMNIVSSKLSAFNVFISIFFLGGGVTLEVLHYVKYLLDFKIAENEQIINECLTYLSYKACVQKSRH